MVDYEIKKIKDKVKRDTENLQDSQEYIKVCYFHNGKLYVLCHFRHKRFLS